MSEYKTDIEVANEILAIIQNVPDFEDALDFTRIYIDALNTATNSARYDKSKIVKIISATDSRFQEI